MQNVNKFRKKNLTCVIFHKLANDKKKKNKPLQIKLRNLIERGEIREERGEEKLED